MHPAEGELHQTRVLIVDDEKTILRAWERILAREKWQVETCDNGLEALDRFREEPFDVVMLDIMMPQISGMDVLREIKARNPDTEVIMMTAYATIDTAVQAIKLGAYEYLTKPFENIDAVANLVHRAVERKRLVDYNRRLENELEVRNRFEGMVGGSPRMQEVFKLVESVAYSTASVLIQGESGTGKELVAKAIHYRSPRKDRAFVVVNCSALTETLLESELFGHVKGSFTGAISNKKGLFEMADRGTVFLDEIGEIPLQTQVKLLRVLQEGEVKRVGSNDVIQVDVRVVAATNRPMQEAVRKGVFREDLFYRLNVINIHLPPLRERREDIPLLAYHFLRKYNDRMQKHIERISPEAMAQLSIYEWPGNVRELENVVERAVVLQHAEAVLPGDLPPHLVQARPILDRASHRNLVHLPYKQAKDLAVSAFERQYLTALIEQAQGNISQAARAAGLDRSNFRRMLKKCKLMGELKDDDGGDEEEGAEQPEA